MLFKLFLASLVSLAFSILAYGTIDAVSAQEDITSTITRPTTERSVDIAYAILGKRLRRLVETYLRTDCEIDEVDQHLLALRPVALLIVPYLTAVKREGPPTPVLTDFGRELEKNWKDRLAFLETPDALELREESFKMMKAITKDQYRQDQSSALQAKYRQRAALALRRLPCLSQEATTVATNRCRIN